MLGVVKVNETTTVYIKKLILPLSRSRSHHQSKILTLQNTYRVKYFTLMMASGMC